jgi:nucleoside-diphosphate-sugar epimerase
MLNTIRRGFFAFIGPKGGSANYVHVQDVVQALMLCIAHPNAVNQTYIVSAWAVIEDMVSGLSTGAGLKPPVWRVPLRLASIVASMMQIWPKWPLTISRVQALSSRSQYSTKKIETELGWKLTVPVEEGMRQFSQELWK